VDFKVELRIKIEKMPLEDEGKSHDKNETLEMGAHAAGGLSADG